jgi:hypothetical protein
MWEELITPVLFGGFSFLDQVKLEEEPVSPPLSPPAMEENSIIISPTRPPVITDLLIDSYQVALDSSIRNVIGFSLTFRLA